MSTFFLGLFYFLYEAVGPMVARVLLSLGFGIATFTGGMAAFSYISTQAQDKITGLPAAMLPWVGMLSLDKVITLLISAYAFRALFRGLSSSATVMTRTGMPWGAPGGLGSGNDLSA